MFSCKKQQGQQGEERNILQTSLADEKSSLVPSGSISGAGVPRSGAAVVLELVPVPAAARLSGAVLLLHLAATCER